MKKLIKTIMIGMLVLCTCIMGIKPIEVSAATHNIKLNIGSNVSGLKYTLKKSDGTTLRVYNGSVIGVPTSLSTTKQTWYIISTDSNGNQFKQAITICPAWMKNYDQLDVGFYGSNGRVSSSKANWVTLISIPIKVVKSPFAENYTLSIKDWTGNTFNIYNKGNLIVPYTEGDCTAKMFTLTCETSNRKTYTQFCNVVPAWMKNYSRFEINLSGDPFITEMKADWINKN